MRNDYVNPSGQGQQSSPILPEETKLMGLMGRRQQTAQATEPQLTAYRHQAWRWLTELQPETKVRRYQIPEASLLHEDRMSTGLQTKPAQQTAVRAWHRGPCAELQYSRIV